VRNSLGDDKKRTVLECVVNISEGRNLAVLQALSQSAGTSLLDIHTDADHNRSVFTMLGTKPTRLLAKHAIDLLTLQGHEGVHPRLGVVDVVPFVALRGSHDSDALLARNDFAAWAAHELGVPCFLYGPERTLPDIRRNAWKSLLPDIGPAEPHPTAGAMCVGVRELLVAYNVFLETDDIAVAHEIVRAIRRPGVRALAFAVDGFAQISMNLVDLHTVGIESAYDAVAQHAAIQRAELVGLIPRFALDAIDESRWVQLDIGVESTIEWRMKNPSIFNSSNERI
jgi:glutamate formiminotransferase